MRASKIIGKYLLSYSMLGNLYLGKIIFRSDNLKKTTNQKKLNKFEEDSRTSLKINKN